MKHKHGMYISAVRAYQKVTVSFNMKENTNIQLTAEEVKELNEEIIEIIVNNIEVDEIDDSRDVELIASGFDTTPITDEYDYDFYLAVPIIIYGNGYIDYNYDGGDGYDETDLEDFEEGIKSINKGEILKKLVNLKKIGQYIDEASLYTSFKDDLENEEYVEDSYYDEDDDQYDY